MPFNQYIVAISTGFREYRNTRYYFFKSLTKAKAFTHDVLGRGYFRCTGSMSFAFTQYAKEYSGGNVTGYLYSLLGCHAVPFYRKFEGKLPENGTEMLFENEVWKVKG